MILPQKPFEIRINLDKFPVKRVYASFVTESVYLSPHSLRSVVICILQNMEPFYYTYGMAVLSRESFDAAELQEIAFTEAVMDLIYDYVDTLPLAHQKTAELRLLEEFLSELKKARCKRGNEKLATSHSGLVQ